MKLHLTNLDELIQKVRNIHPKNYLNEAISSYRAGAYRSALIATWIAVCVDIIEKIRELAASGDKAAAGIVSRLDKIGQNDHGGMLAFEKDLLSIACDELEFISVIEKLHLERLKEDRNICAHPTFSNDGSQFSPNAELVLAYIVQAANYLLIHAPVKGKVVIDRLFELVNEPSFPEDDEKAFIVFSSDNNLGRVRESSIRSLATILLKRLFRDGERLSPELLNRISASLGAISRLNPNIYNQVVDGKLSQMLSEATDLQLKRIFPFLVKRKEIWSRVETAVKIRVEGLLSSMTVEELVNYKLTKVAEDNGEINKALQDRVNSLDDGRVFLLLSSVSSSIYKDKAIELFLSSLSFDASESRGKNIILPISKFLNTDDVKKILDGAFENKGAYGHNQIIHAGSIDSFFAQFYDSTKDIDRNHREHWLEFWGRIKEKGISYNSLYNRLVDDGLIDSEEIDTEDFIPF